MNLWAGSIVFCCVVSTLLPIEKGAAFPLGQRQQSPPSNRRGEKHTLMMNSDSSANVVHMRHPTIVEDDFNDCSSSTIRGLSRRSAIHFGWKSAAAVSFGAVAISPVLAESASATTAPNRFENFQRLSPIQFIAALGDPTSTSGTNAARDWGVWTVDPGPRGVRLENSKTLERSKQGPYGWAFDTNDWWLEEHGLIMETPDFSLPSPGKYVVTGGRETTSILTVLEDGSWSLNGGATLADVTHLPCRAARYTRPLGTSAKVCTPSRANPNNFPVRPGALMPKVNGCEQQDYAVIFVIGKAKEEIAAAEKLVMEL